MERTEGSVSAARPAQYKRPALRQHQSLCALSPLADLRPSSTEAPVSSYEAASLRCVLTPLPPHPGVDGRSGRVGAHFAAGCTQAC